MLLNSWNARRKVAFTGNAQKIKCLLDNLQKKLDEGHPFGRRRGREQNYNQSWVTRGSSSDQLSERTGTKAYVPKKVLGLAAGHASINMNNYTTTFREDSNGWNMEGPAYSLWSDDEIDSHTRGTDVFHPHPEFINNEIVEQENEIVSIDVLPDDLQERILASLPLVGLFKACCISQKWNKIVRSDKFVLNDGKALLQKPWYYLFSSSDKQMGYLYDSVRERWYNFELPFDVRHTSVVSSSCGLSCFMDDGNGLEMYVGNPLTGRYTILQKPSATGFAVYTALAFSADRSKPDYTAVVIRSIQASEDFLNWDIAIHVYPSEKKTWLPPWMGRMNKWRSGNVAVICYGVLYILAYATSVVDGHTHGVVAYNFNNQRCIDQVPVVLSAKSSIINAPCPLTCGRLLNVQNTLVLVGGIARLDSPGVIRGVGVWVLEDKGWENITHMPHKIWQGFGEFHEEFASSGSGDLIYVQSYGGAILAVFDLKSKEWNRSNKCPMIKKTKKFPDQTFSGFCFEPNLKVRP